MSLVTDYQENLTNRNHFAILKAKYKGGDIYVNACWRMAE